MIRVRGQAELAENIDVDIPKHQLVVVTGVSGSGKVVVGVRHDRRRVGTSAERDVLGVRAVPDAELRPPDVDLLENLSAVIVVDQKRLSGGPRSTVAPSVISVLAYGCCIRGSPNRPSGIRMRTASTIRPGYCPGCEDSG